MKKLLAVLFVVLQMGNFALYAAPDVFSTGGNSDGSYEFRMIKDEGLKVGNGTPTTTMDGEDAYVEGTFEVDGAARFDSTVAIGGVMTISAIPVFAPTATDITVTSPTVAGQIVRTSAYVLYIATGTGVITAWSKVGGQ